MEIEGWLVVNGMLVREFEFEDQTEAAEFILLVAKMSDAMGHHCEVLHHSWNKFRLSICTHDAGNTITEKDYFWAEEVNRIVGK